MEERLDSDNKLISVVVPNYNREDLIVDALNSVFKQSYRPLQLVIVDDGSTDGSVRSINTWISQHQTSDFEPSLIIQNNAGGNAARNKGIENSRGDYVAFLDSDDLWHTDKLTKQIIKLQSNEDFGAVYCGLQHINADDGTVIERVSRSYLQGNILNRLLIKDETAPTSTYLVKKAVFSEVGMFDLSLAARQDWDMWIRVASRYKIAAVEEILVDYRHHSGLRTASDPQKEIKAYESIRSKYEDLIDSKGKYVRNAADAAYHKRMARVFFHQNISYKNALKHALHALRLNPKDFDAYAVLIGMFLPKGIRRSLHRVWNKLFGSTSAAIKSH